MYKLSPFIVAVALCAAAPASKPLEQWVKFVDPAYCVPSPSFGDFLSSAMIWDETLSSPRIRLGKLKIPATYRSQVGVPTIQSQGFEHYVTIPIKGSWHGLRMRSVVVYQLEESEGGAWYVFNATTEQVRAVANRLGFQIPSSGKRYTDGGAMGVTIGVANYEGNGSLYCFLG